MWYAGHKPFVVVMMFKILVLQSLYNLSDNALEMQILDRMSLMHFLGLSLGQPVPDATTIWEVIPRPYLPLPDLVFG